MKEKDTAYKILWSTIEDFVGLWEILWELNSVLPENSRLENQDISKKILRYFLEHNLVSIYLSKWGSDELEAKDNSEALKLIEDEKYWNAPAINEICVKIGNTEKGVKYYSEDMIGDFI